MRDGWSKKVKKNKGVGKMGEVGLKRHEGECYKTH